jgi:hypothetical protein
MKRFLRIAVVLGMLLTVLPHATAHPASRSRTVSGSYKVPTFTATRFTDNCQDNLPVKGTMHACLRFIPTTNDRFLVVKITDETGLAVPGGVLHAGVSTPFCGETAAPIRLTPGRPIYIYVNPIGVVPVCQTVATSGTVTATLTSGGADQ